MVKFQLIIYIDGGRKEMKKLDGRKKPGMVLCVNIVLCSCLLLYCKEDLIYMLSLTFFFLNKCFLF